MDEFLDVVELFVKVLETRVGLLTLRVRLGANKLFFDPLLHLLQQIAVRLDQMVGKNAFHIGGWRVPAFFRLPC